MDRFRPFGLNLEAKPVEGSACPPARSVRKRCEYRSLEKKQVSQETSQSSNPYQIKVFRVVFFFRIRPHLVGVEQRPHQTRCV